MKNTLLGSIYLILTSSIWGAMYAVVKVVVEVIPPLELVWMRYVVVILALLIIGLITRQKWRIEKKYFFTIIAIGIIGNAITIVAQETGTMLSTAQMGAIITSSPPAFMVIFARLAGKEEKNDQGSNFERFKGYSSYL
ncbi:EamA family transporter [Fictibacillus sp. S7]|nr:EamA family transporter [Fictibacillus sp. S7]SCB80141.1 EamA-like transporter family protein [Fictibacillus enclensis]